MNSQWALDALKKRYESELFDYVLPFWADRSPDLENGGIYCCLDSDGKVYSTDKSVWAQGRMAWVFSALANRYPQHGDRAKWLSIAKSCIDFLNAHCIDQSDRRMYFTVTDDGLPLRKRRYYFSETFYIIGCAEYALAAGDAQALEKAREYYEFVWSMYRDPASDPYKITPKTIETMRSVKAFANTMILLNVTDVMRRCDPGNAELYCSRTKTLISDMRVFIRPELKAVLEIVGADSSVHDWYSAGRVVNPGHAIEASWFLYSQALYFGDSELKKTAEAMFDWSMERGWDMQYGGILYFTDLLGFPPEQYEHDMKLWWPHCEALIASLMFYHDSRDGRYLELFCNLTDYSFDKFSDHKSGDWYGYLRRDGVPTLPACKGSTYKSGFHVIRMLVTVLQLLESL